MRKSNIRHGQARRPPMSPAWPVLAGVVLAVLVVLPFLPHIFGAR